MAIPDGKPDDSSLGQGVQSAKAGWPYTDHHFACITVEHHTVIKDLNASKWAFGWDSMAEPSLHGSAVPAAIFHLFLLKSCVYWA